MLEIIIPNNYCQDILAAAARYARRPVAIKLLPDRLRVMGMRPEHLALSLVYSAFSRYEQEQLARLLGRYYRCFNEAERCRILELAQGLLQEEPCRGRIYSGPRRDAILAALLARELALGPVDFVGFCRFRLAGYREYLRYILTLAADELLSEQEQAEYLTLLREAAAPGRNSAVLHLFFSPGSRFRLWRESEDGIQDLEGGWYSAETLLSNLIALRPARLVLHDPELALEQLPEQLAEIFGQRLEIGAATKQA